MNTMGISEFKAQALKILNLIAKSHESLIITKRGRPLVKILPCTTETAVDAAIPGQLAHTLVFEKDIVSPLDEAMWEACD
jgi:prevent-host-death family protein